MEGVGGQENYGLFPLFVTYSNLHASPIRMEKNVKILSRKTIRVWKKAGAVTYFLIIMSIKKGRRKG